MSFERNFWRLRFRNRFLEATGTEFETFVQSILELRFPDDYVPVKAAGSIGDKKNDGLLRDQRILLGIHAPQSWNKKSVLNKIDTDFAGAVEHWSDEFDTWILVHNDPHGVPPYVIERLTEHTADDSSPKTCDHWGFAQLRDIVFELDDEELTELLGPPLRLTDVLATEVHDIIPMLKELENLPAAPPAEVRPVPPDKLEQNDLSEAAADLLLVGMRRSDEVGKYFARQTRRPLFRDDLGARFRAQYEALRDDGLDPDQIIMALISWIAGPQPLPRTQAGALAIAAFFFEQCDIYEVTLDGGQS